MLQHDNFAFNFGSRLADFDYITFLRLAFVVILG